MSSSAPEDADALTVVSVSPPAKRRSPEEEEKRSASTSPESAAEPERVSMFSVPAARRPVASIFPDDARMTASVRERSSIVSTAAPVSSCANSAEEAILRGRRTVSVLAGSWL